MKRRNRSQSRHDNFVSNSARGYKSLGYTVRADVKGFKSPSTIGGRIPDVVATKGSNKIVVEVETPASMKADKAQRNVFRKYANARKNVSFRTRVAR